VIISASGLSVSPRKVIRLVRQYEHSVQRNGWRFFDFIATQLTLTAEQQSRVKSDPDAYRTIQYLDRTGETAVENVMRERSRR